ncbi:MAG TPA: Maf family nucleotide pyrophosphatase [Chitinophagaceae bacterium]
MQSIVLASQSPRRKQLMEWAEIPFQVICQFTDESFPADMPVEEVPVHVAREKARVTREHIREAYHGRHADQPVLAADTIVVLDNEVINKPADLEEAVMMLQKLSGRSHRVITGVVILYGDREISFADITEVEFHPLTEAQIRFYVEKYEPLDKAGAYAIQEWIGVVGIKSIRGDFYNVMGLPVSRVIQSLQQLWAAQG